MRFSADGTLSQQTFLAEFWQKKPCLMRQAFPGFKPQLDADDVAGLACEELAESRLVTGNFEARNWKVRHGPFTERTLRRLPDTDWTLLVQDVEKHYPPLRVLLAEFDFLPGWRMDDLMISVAAPGGSVGPHVDQYDVFLLQASGRRRWRIAESFYPGLLDGCDLKVLEDFAAEREWDLEPGDVLYLPPNVAHHGIALEACMTWSIGLRAPSQADLLLALAEWLADDWQEGSRYTDGPLSGAPRPGELSPAEAARIRKLMRSPMPPRQEFDRFIAQFLSRYRLAHEPAAPKKVLTGKKLAEELAGSRTLHRSPWTRMVWLEQGRSARLFAAGDAFDCPVDVAMRICSPGGEIIFDSVPDARTIEQLCRMVNAGHLYLV